MVSQFRLPDSHNRDIEVTTEQSRKGQHRVDDIEGEGESQAPCEVLPRCHDFGHTSTKCSGPDFSRTCSNCGVDGHVVKQCTMAGKVYVAYERAGLNVESHRMGSCSCAARRAATRPVPVPDECKYRNAR